jgi:hypothetical protein
LTTEIRTAERLVNYPRNLRKDDAAVDQMVASIREFGFAIPVLARSSGEVVSTATCDSRRRARWDRCPAAARRESQ